MTNTEMLNELRWKKFPVLNDGFVCLVDAMGDDAAICQAARTSYGNDRRGEPNCCPSCQKLGFWKGSDSPDFKISEHNGDMLCIKCGTEWNIKDEEDKDRHLIRYLMRHRHSTPLEMAEVKLLVRVPMDCWRQWVRC